MRPKPIGPICFLFILVSGIVMARNIPSDKSDSKTTEEEVKGQEDFEQEDNEQDESEEVQTDEEDHPPIHMINSRIQNKNVIIHGDILAPPEVGFERAIVKQHRARRWENNVVPYVISATYSKHERYAIRVALTQLRIRTCFKFPERTNQRDYVSIEKRDGCYSHLGRMGGAQVLSLGRGCVHKSVIQHEILHALGIQHEHQRPDRDNYIRVLYNHIQRGMECKLSVDPLNSNFRISAQVEKLSHSNVDLHDLRYDYRSIMHYRGDAFGQVGRNGKPLHTMVALKKGVKLRHNKILTRTDMKRLNILGNCKAGNHLFSTMSFILAAKNKKHRRHRKHSPRHN
ncbi:Metalloendopeptidase [Aphelenchoides besseyi]|nr:Metalloendopeptidase [Aphelenchoides besseyi]